MTDDQKFKNQKIRGMLTQQNKKPIQAFESRNIRFLRKKLNPIEIASLKRCNHDDMEVSNEIIRLRFISDYCPRYFRSRQNGIS